MAATENIIAIKDMTIDDNEEASSSVNMSSCYENGNAGDSEEKTLAAATAVETEEIDEKNSEGGEVEEEGKEGEYLEEKKAVVEREEDGGEVENEEIAGGEKLVAASVEMDNIEEQVEPDDSKSALSKIEDEIDELASQIENETSILSKYDTNESVYGGQSITIGAGKSFNAPVSVTTAGSIVEYTIEVEAYDVDVGITVQRDNADDNKQTVVKKSSRIESGSPLEQKILIRKVPCVINFLFDNEFSWFYEKKISYQIAVKPPSVKKFVKERDRKVEVYLSLLDKEFKNFSDDNLKRIKDNKDDAIENIGKIEKSIREAEQLLITLNKELEDTKESLLVMKNEESSAISRIEKRQEERNSLLLRLEEEKKRGQSIEEEEKTEQTSESNDIANE